MRTANLSIIMLFMVMSVFSQSKSAKGELNKSKKEIPTVRIIPGKGIVISYVAIDVRGRYDYGFSSGFIFYDLDLNQKWKLDNLNEYSLKGQEQVNKLFALFSTGTTSYSVTKDGNHMFMHDFVDNEITVIDIKTGESKVVKSSFVLPHEYGYLNYSVDSSTFVVSYVTYTNKKSESGDFDSKLFVVRYTPELKEDIQEMDIKSVGSSKHKVRLISDSSPSSRKWQIMGGSAEYVLLQDSYILHDSNQDQNYRRLLSISITGETKEVLIPFGEYDNKNERYYGKTFCEATTNYKFYNVYIASQPDKNVNINVQIIDLDLNMLAETSINTNVKRSKIWSDFDLKPSALGYYEIFVNEDNSLYRIKVESDYSKINYEKTHPLKGDCVKKYNNYRLTCYDYEILKPKFTTLEKFVVNDESKTKSPVNVELFQSGKSVYLIKTPQIKLKPESFFEIYKIDK